MADPLVTCVCVTGRRYTTYEFLPQVIQCFCRQNYRKRQLLLISDSDRVGPIDNLDGIFLHRVKAGMPLGAMRNIGLAFAAKCDSLCMQWDDDDWYRFDRISQQVKAWKEAGRDKAVFLESQLCYSFLTGDFGVRRLPNSCIHGSILAPANYSSYPETRMAEDTAYFRDWITNDRVAVMQNDPGLYVRFAHGFNTWPHSHVIREFGNEVGLFPPTEVHREQLIEDVLPDYPRLNRAWLSVRNLFKSHPARIQFVPPEPVKEVESGSMIVSA
jgi:hypothetical protein